MYGDELHSDRLKEWSWKGLGIDTNGAECALFSSGGSFIIIISIISLSTRLDNQYPFYIIILKKHHYWD